MHRESAAVSWVQAPRASALGPGTVDVWAVVVDRAAERWALAGRLSAGEHASMRRRRGADRRRCAVARAALRQLLAEYLDARPHELRFVRARHGKPRLAAPYTGRVEFNVSHSGALALIAVSSAGGVGIDVETLDRRAPNVLASHAFHDAERAAIAGRPPRDRTRAILEHWTAKEAYLKALGTGLHAPPPLVALPPSVPEPGTPATVIPGALSGGLVFARLALRGYVAGVVFVPDVTRLRCLLYAPTSAPS